MEFVVMLKEDPFYPELPILLQQAHFKGGIHVRVASPRIVSHASRSLRRAVELVKIERSS